jgi:hypothetical protein
MQLTSRLSRPGLESGRKTGVNDVFYLHWQVHRRRRADLFVVVVRLVEYPMDISRSRPSRQVRGY